ncbi:putative ferric reductase like transmembrane component family protein [Diplodia seriata]|uniref:Putative ferric reductase like transmembrane component family protein n=1 Tax=Diplodia seriata TaxID=420778 RepID=A0A0G2DYU0_9PEZI|nr:putative ferric reductase like transmembrane component family protein [Diplodia seriata]
MDMDMGGMDMGGTDMGSSVPGVPSLDFLMQYYWAVVGTFIGIATLANVTNTLICRQRLTAACRGDAKPAKPEALLLRINATATAIIREASNATLSPLTLKGRSICLPTVGRTTIVAANVVTLLVLCFYKFDLNDQWSFEDIGYRTVTIHMGYWFADWAPYNYIGSKIKTDPITQHGLISWCLLLWIVFSSVAPIRGLSYEFFVLQHLGSMAVFIAFVYLHVNSWPMYVRIYVILPIALVCFDRVVRAIWLLYNNFSIFHPSQRKESRTSSIWACEASFTPLSHGTTRITIHNPPFDSVVLFAGSTGATFTMPLLRDIVAHWKKQQLQGGVEKASSTLSSKLRLPDGAATRRVRFVWVVKSRGQLGWFAEQLSRVAEDVAALRQAGMDVDVDMSVYVTCDSSFTDDRKVAYSTGGDPTTALPSISAPKVDGAIDEKTYFKKGEDGSRVTETEGRDSDTLTRRVLERALGETAVVACGPAALGADVRSAVVRLSDERAVHRGTGAQGVWCHVEGFGY